jgi:hypothetical protein
MKQFLITLLLTASATAFANPYHGGHWRHHHSPRVHWIVPAVIGGAVVYGVTRQDNVVIQPQSPAVIYTERGVFQTYTQNCSAWTETQMPDGSITRTRTCQ